MEVPSAGFLKTTWLCLTFFLGAFLCWGRAVFSLGKDPRGAPQLSNRDGTGSVLKLLIMNSNNNNVTTIDPALGMCIRAGDTVSENKVPALVEVMRKPSRASMTEGWWP